MTEKVLSGLYEEIIKIRQLLEISLKDSLKKELEKILSTPERKAIWALSDGFTNTASIAERTKLSQRAVQFALNDLENAGLIVFQKRGYPRRMFDFVPSNWRPKGEEEHE